MALLSSVYGFTVPIVFALTIPIAAFAALTTTLAFSILFLRVVLVYIELTLAVIPRYLLSPNPTPYDPGTIAVSERRGKRSPAGSAGSITPIASGIGLGLDQRLSHARDYEGVGGWRLGPPSDDDALWAKINSRLELPADHGKRHRRSLTGGIPGGKAGFESVVSTARAGTPFNAMLSGEGSPKKVSSRPGALSRTPSGLTQGPRAV